MQKIITLFILFFIPFLVSSQETDTHKKWGYKGYSGGMFIHTGYIQSKPFAVFDYRNGNIVQQVKGATFGLGGKMSIYLNNYFRMGGEGYFSTCTYGVLKNSCRIGWGGITFDALCLVKKWTPFMGVTVGGGSASHLIMLGYKEITLSELPAIFLKRALVIVSPSMGVEYFATNRISLLCKVDYMLNVYKNEKSYPQGVRFYLGLHFYQKK